LGAIQSLQRYEGTPIADRDGGAWRNKVLHAVFEGPGLRLYAGDGADSEPMKGCAILLEHDDVDSAQTLFATLSAGGRITVPFRKQFWGEYYGNFTDKFGVQWAVSSPSES
jgi:PhnB protein